MLLIIRYLAPMLLLITIAYLSVMILGDNNSIEEASEDILKTQYKIDIDFNAIHDYGYIIGTK